MKYCILLHQQSQIARRNQLMAQVWHSRQEALHARADRTGSGGRAPAGRTGPATGHLLYILNRLGRRFDISKKYSKKYCKHIATK